MIAECVNSFFLIKFLKVFWKFLEGNVFCVLNVFFVVELFWSDVDELNIFRRDLFLKFFNGDLLNVWGFHIFRRLSFFISFATALIVEVKSLKGLEE